MRTYFHLIFIFVLLIVASPVWASTASGTITLEFDLSAHDKDEQVQLWIPYPVTNNNQTIDNILINGNYVSSGVYTDAKFQSPMLYARWEPGTASRKLTFLFDVKRNEVIRRDFPARETNWDPKDYAPYLGATRLGPVDGAVKERAESITAGQATVLGKARAIYDWTCRNTFRKPETRGCGAGDVCKLLKEPGGKCTDISSLFVALCRAAGIPAREIFGIRQGRKPEQDITSWQHCWAEFYMPGYGWVPVDPADVRKMMLVQNLEDFDGKTAEYREYYWGGIDPFRIKLGEGRDIELNPPQSGPPVNYLMYPFAQVGDETLDWLEPASFAYTITYRQH